MRDLGIDTALLFPGAPPDEYPLWSPDGQSFALNVQGYWVAYELNGITFSGADWHNEMIGIISGISNPSPKLLSEEEVSQWRDTTLFGPREVATEDGRIFELRQQGFVTSFVTTPVSGDETIHWTSGGENCHSMSLSPDQRVLLFICEMNGVMAYLIP